MNQFSKKTGVVNSNNPSGLNSFYHNQALYLTNNSSAKYTIGTVRAINACYKGAIIIWYDKSALSSNVYLYYVDRDGNQSNKYYVFKR